MRNRITGLVLLLALVASALMAACGGDEPTATTRPTSISPTPTSIAPAPATTTPVPTTTSPPDPTPTLLAMMEPDPNVVLIVLSQLNDSGQSGWAKLVASGTDTHITLSLSEGAMTSGLAHVHAGQCDSLGSAVYSLTNFSTGMSVTLLEDVSLDSLLTGAFAFNTHNADNPAIYTACGDIPDPESYVTIALDEVNVSGQSGFASLTPRNGST